MRASVLRAVAHVRRVLAEVEVFAEAFGLRACALRAGLDDIRPALRGLARRARRVLHALAYVVPIVQLARLAPRGLAPLLKLVSVVSHKFSSEG